jgi:hypothetical protein
MPIVRKSSSSKKVITLSVNPVNIIKSKPATEVVLDVTDLGPLAAIAATDITTLTNGDLLAFDSTIGQFITTSVIGAATTNIGGYAVTTGSPADNSVLTFHADDQKWVYDSPYDIVDLSDGVQDDQQDYGSF